MRTQGLHLAVALSLAAHLFLFAVSSRFIGKQSFLNFPISISVDLVSEPAPSRVITPRAEEEKEKTDGREKQKAEPKAPAKGAEKAALEKKAIANTPAIDTEYKKKALDAIRDRKHVQDSLSRVREKAKEISVGKASISSLSGAAMKGPGRPGQRGSEKSPEDIYGENLGAAIKGFWYFPKVRKQGLETVVSIKVMKNGTIKIDRVEKSSGNALFDESALRAIKKASPYEPPPAQYEYSLRFSDEEL